MFLYFLLLCINGVYSLSYYIFIDLLFRIIRVLIIRKHLYFFFLISNIGCLYIHNGYVFRQDKALFLLHHFKINVCQMCCCQDNYHYKQHVPGRFQTSTSLGTRRHLNLLCRRLHRDLAGYKCSCI